MRNYDKRLAEIHLRGEALTRKRKKLRRGILLGSISAVLCFMLFAAPFLPSRTPSGEAPEIGFEMMGSSGGNGNGVSVWVENAQTSTSYSVHEDAITVEALLREITTVYKSTSAQDPAAPTEQADGTSNPGGKEENKGIVINAVLSNGTQRSYLLLDTALQDTKTGKVYPMTAQQAQQLKKLIQEAKP